MEITSNGKVIARFVDSEKMKSPGLTFFSLESEGVQVGTWRYDAGKKLIPHIHNLIDKYSSRTSEVIYVVSGSLHADIYDEDETLVSELTLVEGDLLICLGGGHGYRILEPNTFVIEMKNGPYHGPDLDRKRIEDKCTL